MKPIFLLMFPSKLRACHVYQYVFTSANCVHVLYITVFIISAAAHFLYVTMSSITYNNGSEGIFLLVNNRLVPYTADMVISPLTTQPFPITTIKQKREGNTMNQYVQKYLPFLSMPLKKSLDLVRCRN